MMTQPVGIKLQEWAKANQPVETLIYKEGYWDQINFVLDVLADILARDFDDYIAILNNIRVISTHTSKSVLLPVFRVELKDGTAFTMRNNFYDWKISVSSPRRIVEIDPMGLFDPLKRINDVYCQGFPEQLVYGPYADNQLQFTIELPGGNYHAFTFFWIFAYKMLGDKKKG